VSKQLKLTSEEKAAIVLDVWPMRMSQGSAAKKYKLTTSQVQTVIAEAKSKMMYAFDKTTGRNGDRKIYKGLAEENAKLRALCAELYIETRLARD